MLNSPGCPVEIYMRLTLLSTLFFLRMTKIVATQMLLDVILLSLQEIFQISLFNFLAFTESGNNVDCIIIRNL